MDEIFLKKIEGDYEKTKLQFQKDVNASASDVAEQIKEYSKIFQEVFRFLIKAFERKLRKDEKTPLVFHSIYLPKLIYICGIRDLETLLIASLHDVLEDTRITEAELSSQPFVEEELIPKLKLLKEDSSLSREPDGKNLPPRYKAHIKKLMGSSAKILNVEILDRFSDLMDLEYIIELTEEEKSLRLKSKIIKVRSFVENLTRTRTDFSQECLSLFNYKLKQRMKEFNIDAEAEIIY